MFLLPLSLGFTHFSPTVSVKSLVEHCAPRADPAMQRLQPSAAVVDWLSKLQQSIVCCGECTSVR